MATKTGLKFSVAAIDNAKEILKALPPAPRETKEVGLREAIEELAPTIRGLLGKGYSRQQIVDLIQEQGVACTLATLKSYFRRGQGKTKGKPAAASPAATREADPPPARLVVRDHAATSNAAPSAASGTDAPHSAPGGGPPRESGTGVGVAGAAGRTTAKAS